MVEAGACAARASTSENIRTAISLRRADERQPRFAYPTQLIVAPVGLYTSPLPKKRTIKPKRTWGDAKPPKKRFQQPRASGGTLKAISSVWRLYAASQATKEKPDLRVVHANATSSKRPTTLVKYTNNQLSLQAFAKKLKILSPKCPPIGALQLS
jgi:hypothetical protein